MAQEMASIFAVILRGSQSRAVLYLSLAVLLVLIGNMCGQVWLNRWNGNFFEALKARDAASLGNHLILFLGIVGFLLSMVVAQTWLQEMLRVRMRAGLSHALIDEWLVPGRAYRLGFAGPRGAAPDQRIQEDCRLFAEFTTELGIGMLQSLLLFVTFVGVLWGLSGPFAIEIAGEKIHIPGYMVWVAVGYAVLGSGLTWTVGQRLIGLNTARYAREAELRFAVVRVAENAEGVALYGGEADEKRHLGSVLDGVLAAMRRLSWALSRLTWITSGYGWLALVVPIAAAAPGYLAGQLTFGELIMVVGAFTQVQAALRYFVDHFPKFADWRSAVFRVAMFRRAMEDFEATVPEERIVIRPHPQGRLSFESLAVTLADGRIIVEEATAEIRPGERVLIGGVSGCGKSTLFRAIAGLWPWGSGVIRRPPAEQLWFMPQRPYLPLGSLRKAVCYPSSPDLYSEDEVRAAMTRCQLSEFFESLDRADRWDRTLSLGQQQRLTFARLLLHRPQWVFLDEATSALDEESQAALLSLFDSELEGTTVLSIAHRPGLEAFHTRTLHLVQTPGGSRLFTKKAEPAEKARLAV